MALDFLAERSSDAAHDDLHLLCNPKDVREKFYLNMLGEHVEAGTWLADERLRMLTGGLASNSSGSDESHARSLVVLAGEIKQQAYTLAYSDSFLVIAWVCVGMMILIACMKVMKIYFDTPPMEPPR